MPAAIHTVAIFDATDDTVAMLTMLLSGHGYRTVSGRADHVQSGELDFVQFLTTHQPSVIIWNIAPRTIGTGDFSSWCARFAHSTTVRPF